MYCTLRTSSTLILASQSVLYGTRQLNFSGWNHVKLPANSGMSQSMNMKKHLHCVNSGANMRVDHLPRQIASSSHGTQASSMKVSIFRKTNQHMIQGVWDTQFSLVQKCSLDYIRKEKPPLRAANETSRFRNLWSGPGLSGPARYKREREKKRILMGVSCS